MFSRIRKRIDRELRGFLETADQFYKLSRTSPLLYRSIKEFILRPGKRVRPVLCVIGYNGFSSRTAEGLYTAALSIELLHDFMLVHDDIIDRSDMRRGKPALHSVFSAYYRRHKNIRFTGQDMAIVAGDVIYALALHALNAVKVSQDRKTQALRILVRAALHTGIGEFIELADGARDLGAMTREDIDRIYDHKTAYYTFAAPLCMGAVLAGARQSQAGLLQTYGMNLGRAFQIRDDILGLFGEEEDTGKSSLTDLQEGKKTILIWYSYGHSDRKGKKIIQDMMNRGRATQKDLLIIRDIVVSSGALAYAEKEIALLLVSARTVLQSSRLSPCCKKALLRFSDSLFAPSA